MAVKDSKLVSDILDLSSYPKAEIAFRSAWILEYIEENHPQSFFPYFDRFCSSYSTQNNQSCRRHFTKIMMRITSLKAPGYYRQAIAFVDLDNIIDSTFDWLIDPQTPVAVQVNCMDILFNLRKYSNWIEDELRAQTQFLLINGSAAMQSRGKKILKKLAR